MYDCVLSNPPWTPLVELKGEKGKRVRELVKGFLKDDDPRTAILMGGNLASVFVGLFSRPARLSAFVLPSSVVYDGSSYGVGKILTYRAVENSPHRVYVLTEDVFGHGSRASLVMAGRGEGEVLEVSPEWNVRPLGTTLKDSLKEAFEYFASRTNLEELLGVEKVHRRGTYITGLVGNNERDGLIIEEVGDLGVRLNSGYLFVSIPDQAIRRLLYYPNVKPFFSDIVSVVAPLEGEERLKEVLLEASEKAPPDYRSRLESLARIARIRQDVLFKGGSFYVVFRGVGAPVASVIEGKPGMFGDQRLAFIETKENQAFYYAGVLSYLTSRVPTGFLRNQFARPLLALVKAGLEWRDEDWQYEVADLSRAIHEIAPARYSELRKRGTKLVRKYLEALDEVEEWERLKSILDSHVKDLDAAIAMIAKTKR